MNATSPSLEQALAPAYRAFERDDAAAAWQLAQEAMRNHPQAFEAQIFAAAAALSAGEQKQALVHFSEAFHLAPTPESRAMTWLGTGRAQVELGEHLQALQAFERGLALLPNHPELHSGMATALLGLGRFEQAEQEAYKALTLYPDDTRAKVALGVALMRQNRLAEARDQLERLRHDPHFGYEAGLHLASLYGIIGDHQGARNMLENLLNLKPTPPVFESWAQRISFESRDEAAYHRLLAREKDMNKLNESERTDIFFALAKAHDDLDDPDRASRDLREANHLETMRKPYDPAEDEALMGRIGELFNSEFIRRYESLGLADPQPVFIASLPRSGSTLIEQMLASHSHINGGGELEHLAQVANILSLKWGAHSRFPDIPRDEAASDLREAAMRYKEKTTRLALIHSHFTDKSLLNFLYIGLIRMLLPKARIIHIRRHPLATAFGLYRQHFSRGLRYSYDLGHIVRYYRAYDRLMQHWREVVPNAFVELYYEDLVRDPEGQLKRVMDYIDLEFEPGMLDFYKLQRPVQTLSQTQVRQPLNASGLHRHERYNELLAPAAEALKEEISAYEAELLQGGSD